MKSLLFTVAFSISTTAFAAFDSYDVNYLRENAGSSPTWLIQGPSAPDNGTHSLSAGPGPDAYASMTWGSPDNSTFTLNGLTYIIPGDTGALSQLGASFTIAYSQRVTFDYQISADAGAIYQFYMPGAFNVRETPVGAEGTNITNGHISVILEPGTYDFNMETNATSGFSGGAAINIAYATTLTFQSAVPEPSEYAVGIIALLGATILLRRKKAALN